MKRSRSLSILAILLLSLATIAPSLPVPVPPVSQWVTPREQPFPQLERQTFGEGDAPALQRLVGAEVTRGKLMALVAEGWRWIRGERLDGIERRGAGWRVELHIEPPFFPGGGVDDPDSSITAVNLGGGGMPPVLRSELQLQLTRSFG